MYLSTNVPVSNVLSSTHLSCSILFFYPPSIISAEKEKQDFYKLTLNLAGPTETVLTKQISENRQTTRQTKR